MKKDRGMWEIEEKTDGLERYKIDKAEDSLRRRMRLKRDYQAAFKEYLSVSAFQEKMKSKASMQSNNSSKLLFGRKKRGKIVSKVSAN